MEELRVLHNNNTWILVTPPPNANIVSFQWVFKVKRNEDGSFARQKACLVARGFNQVEGLDFHETYSPIIKFTTVQLILAIEVTKKWCLHQLHINNAFLHDNLEEKVYMSHNHPATRIQPSPIMFVCCIDLFIAFINRQLTHP